MALVTWAAWALLMFEIGTRILPGRRTHSNPYELLRTIGFAATPGFAAVLAVIPEATTTVLIGSWVWMLAAMVVAVQHALDYEHRSRAIAVCALGLALAVTIALVMGMLFGPTVS